MAKIINFKNALQKKSLGTRFFKNEWTSFMNASNRRKISMIERWILNYDTSKIELIKKALESEDKGLRETARKALDYFYGKEFIAVEERVN